MNTWISSFEKRLEEALAARNIKPVELANRLKVSEGTISNYRKGRCKPRQTRLGEMANILNVSVSWLLGADVPMEPAKQNTTLIDLDTFDNIFPVEKHKIPLLGEIACGQPIFADEDRESYIEIGTDIHADFCLKAHGDSMINARILDGDIVFIRRQEMVENGEIAAVIIDDEATLKRVYYEKDKGKLVLQAENSAYAPLIYIGDELNSIHILGKAIAFQSDVK